MAVDKNKIIAEATKLVQKGAFDKAINAYQKILADDAKDVRILLKIGELHQKKGDDHAAAKAFEKVAETYAEQGFFLKSVAVYKQIVKLDPEDVRVNERLAALYQQLGLMSDAMSQYQFMAAAYERAGDGAKLTDVLKRMVELDPDNIASSIKLGEMYARANQAQPALECFKRAADYLRKHNRADEYLKVAERIAALSPGEVALTRELANIYLAKRDTKRALAKLQLCFKADPKDVDTLQLLAQAFRDLGQTSKTLSVYKELAHVHEERGRPPEAQAIWRKVRELAPDDPEAAAALGAARAPPPRPGASAPVPAPAPEARAVAPPSPAPAAPGLDAIPKLLTETDVYVKYGLHDKAIDHLQKVLAVDPGEPGAHERAREIHLAAGRKAEASRSGALAVRALVARSLPDRARDALSRLRQIDPASSELDALIAAVGGTEEVDLGEGDFEEDDEVVVAPEEVDDDALALAAAGAEGDEEVVEEEAPPVPVARTAPPRPGRAPAVQPKAAPAPPAVARARPAPPAPPPPEETEDADLSDEIEEADFFVQQGLLGEAREALRNLLAFYPDHEVVKAKLADVERRARDEGGEASGAAPAPGASDASFDIARELADEVDAAGPVSSPLDQEFQYSVEDVFNQFKKGVEQTVRAEDSATHYDLGIAYKEMGLLDDAVKEFETAIKGNDRKKEVDCLSMIGLCCMAKNEPRGAIDAFRRALSSDHLTRDAARAIHYDLAAAHEAAGDAEAALYYFQRVVKAEAGFRDAAGRVAALGGGPGRAPPDERPRAPKGAAAPARPAAPRPLPPSPAGSSKKNIGYL